MKLLNIRQGVVTLQLSPEQCADLAQSAGFAAEHSYNDKTGTWQTQAALLQACAVAACTQWHLDPDDEQIIETQLDRLGLTGLANRLPVGAKPPLYISLQSIALIFDFRQTF